MIQEIKLDRITGKPLQDLMAHHQQELFSFWDGLLEKKFTIADINVDHRSVLHWEKEGLIDKSKETKDGWRRFSFFDYVWIRLLINMREFGLPLPILKIVKEVLYQPAYPDLFAAFNESHIEQMSEIIQEDATEKVKKIQSLPEKPDEDLQNKLAVVTHLFLITVLAISSREPSYLLVSKTGETRSVILDEPGLDVKVNTMLQMFEQESMLLVNITKIINDFFSSEKFSGSTYYNLSLLSRQEREIIKIIRSGGIKSISITLKDGNEFYAEVLRKKPAKNVMEEIQGIIAKNKYSRITLDTEKGKVLYINEIEKIIIK
jgi:DNA-binding transcriptional MerR regulator